MDVAGHSGRNLDFGMPRGSSNLDTYIPKYGFMKLSVRATTASPATITVDHGSPNHTFTTHHSEEMEQAQMSMLVGSKGGDKKRVVNSDLLSAPTLSHVPDLQTISDRTNLALRWLGRW
ncbi:hypothetical protein PGT21_006430 [Puccinia graminis f. sp. tritici]|uniref:Uncharacterized protein n=1 Tax=Puccinia graminis f. sp. tritici TaxID=56615 RepID=A0A5B0QSN1_PUCGR|nr:hypothetical protein PGTUg99_003063 [Puccinia graminis f. sp. tritici]KAA1116248.1 hypothetical protein PGT21_006430 [Puccinia graminis f. sp. tritici]KAA1130371.1 hypothetical protein PGTUg99_001931 [Puccinia graminis f. sp. tritici]